MAVSVPTGVGGVWGMVALLLVASSLAGALIGPTPRYELTDRNDLPSNDSERFLQVVEALERRAGEQDRKSGGAHQRAMLFILQSWMRSGTRARA